MKERHLLLFFQQHITQIIKLIVNSIEKNSTVFSKWRQAHEHTSPTDPRRAEVSKAWTFARLVLHNHSATRHFLSLPILPLSLSIKFSNSWIFLPFWFLSNLFSKGASSCCLSSPIFIQSDASQRVVWKHHLSESSVVLASMHIRALYIPVESLTWEVGLGVFS